MSDVQIFISYARSDDLPPPDDSPGFGFVTSLQKQLIYEFTNIGAPRPSVWWDRRGVEDGDPFDHVIQEAVHASSLLVVVLSQNWLDSDYCKKEIGLFRKRWNSETEFEVKHRIKVVRKGHVDIKQRPTLLQGQVGYAFFNFEGAEQRGNERPYFDRGKVVDPLYTTQVRNLSGHLWRAAENLRRKRSPIANNPLVEENKPLPETPRNGRTIYLAKPARDMRRAYQSTWRELYQRGFNVVPALDEDVPLEGPAVAFIDEALSKAEASIHLLGSDPGYAPAESNDRIVKLQLARAVLAKPIQKGSNVFHRIIWAPRILEDAPETAESPERDVDAVVRRFDEPLDGDEVEGGTYGRFIDFVRDHLKRTAPHVEIAPVKNLEANAKVYLCHTKADTDYALDIAAELEKLPTPIEALTPAFGGKPADRRNLHRQYLQECDAVVMCWASAPDVWIKANSLELQNWRDSHRSEKLGFRGLIAGPPPGSDKKNLLRVPPRSQIDKVLDLTQPSRPLPEELKEWFLGAQPNSP